MQFLLLVLCEIVFGLYFFFNFMLVTVYIFSNFYENSKKFLVYWLDYWIIEFYYLFFILLLLVSFANTNVDFILPDMLKHSYIGFFYMGINLISSQNLIQNLTKSTYIFFRRIQSSFKSENKIFDKKFHIILILIQWVTNIIFMWVYYKYELYNILIIKDGESESTFLFVIKMIIYSLIVCSFLSVLILNWKKTNLENFEQSSKIEQKFVAGNIGINFITEMTQSKVDYNYLENVKIRIDFLIYKTLIDITLNIPIILILSIREITTPIMLIHEVLFLIYAFFQANLHFRIDRHYYKIQDSIKAFFCVKYFHLKLGVSTRPKFRNNEVGNFVANNDDIEFINSDSDSHPNFMNMNTTFLRSYPLEIEKLENMNCDNLLNPILDYKQINFFIIFKILWQYFKMNENSFMSLYKKHKNIEENLKSNIDLKSSFISRISNNKNLGLQGIDTNSTFQNISEIKFANVFNLKLSQVFSSIEDLDMKNQFEKVFNNSKLLNKAKLNFQIESLFDDKLKELIPYYQISCKDIMNSLNPDKNKAICKYLQEKKLTEKSFNSYFTYDTFLSFEIYDRDEIFADLENYISLYTNHVKTKIKNWEQTFLPLVIGVFNIKYLEYDKYIILSRHPLAFSPYVSFKYWMNVCFLENEEKITYSSNYTEVIDLKEIEIKDNILMHKEDHSEFIKTIKNDLKFMKTLPFYSEYTLNVFFINDLKNFLSTYNVKRSTVSNELEKNNPIDRNNFERENEIEKEKEEEKGKESMLNNITINRLSTNHKNNPPDLLSDESNELDKSKSNIFSRDFISLLPVTRNSNTIAGKNFSNTYSLKENGSQVNCILEKILTHYVVNNRYLIKIYFSGIFNTNSTLRKNFNQLPEDLNKYHSKILKKQILKILRCQEESLEVGNEMN